MRGNPPAKCGVAIRDTTFHASFEMLRDWQVNEEYLYETKLILNAASRITVLGLLLATPVISSCSTGLSGTPPAPRRTLPIRCSTLPAFGKEPRPVT